MQFDLENPIVKICAAGMMAEGEGDRNKARDLFMQAWNEASDDFEKAIAAHYVARHQQSLSEQLRWNELALECAVRSNDKSANTMLPSLHLNVGKDYEDLGNLDTARTHYEAGLTHSQHLTDDGYSQLVLRGLHNGLARVKII